MKKVLLSAVALITCRWLRNAQMSRRASHPGFYVGAEGGLNWLLQITATASTLVTRSVGRSATTSSPAGEVGRHLPQQLG